MSSLYDRIIEQTKRLNMTGKELGQQLGLKKTPLTDWKNQKSCPTLEIGRASCRERVCQYV